MGIAAFFVMICLFVLTPPAVTGQGKGGKNDQRINNKSLKPEITYRHIGFVQRVGRDEIVVDDHLLKFAKNVSYHSTEPGGLVSRQIKKGFQIGFNRNDKKEITDIWILKSE